MTILDAIHGVDSLKHNTYTQNDKVKWLSRVDGMVKKHILDAHNGTDMAAFTGYDEGTDLNTQLLVPAPYDELYLRWLEAQIDYANGEYGKYNNSITMFNTAFEAFAAYYIRNNMPVSHGQRFIF